LRPLTFNNKFLRRVLRQGVRRFPINMRPLLGIAKSHSTKGMGFLARGFMHLREATGDTAWREKSVNWSPLRTSGKNTGTALQSLLHPRRRM
jgi:hypothetical protein